MKKKGLVIFIFSLLFIGRSVAQQDAAIDSLLQVIVKTDVDTVKGWAYVQLSVKTLNSNTFISKYYASKAKEIFEKADQPVGLSVACLKIAAACRLLNEEAAMLSNIKLALSIAEKINNEDVLADCYHEMALISNEQNDSEKALSYNLKALELKKKLKRDDQLSPIFNNIGIQFAKKNDWKNGIIYFRMALDHEKNRNNVVAIGNEYNNIGIYYIIKKQYDSAFYFLLEGKKLREQGKSKLGISGSCNNLALLYMQLGKTDIALKYADTSYKIAKEINNRAQQQEVLLTYYSIYEARKDYENALHYFREHEKLRKKIESESNNRKLAEIQSSIDLEQKEKQLLQKDLELKDSSEKSRKVYLALFLALGVLALAGGVIWYVFRVNKKVNAANTIISQQKKQTELQKKIIEEKHKDITDSIFYAQKIQESLIIPESQLKKSLPESFVLYRPRDIVSGDFYWFGEKDGCRVLAVADCTGHGVPGAFMSLIGISSLNQIVIEKGITSPAQILTLLREQVIRSFNQADEESHRRDGMDISVIKLQGDKLVFAGANNPCLLIRENEITMLSPDKQPVGYHEQATNFNEQEIRIRKGDAFYLFSDGIVDQFGGPKGKKLKIKYFKEWLQQCAHMEMEAQKKFITEKLISWKKNFDQTDDILIAGIRC